MIAPAASPPDQIDANAICGGAVSRFEKSHAVGEAHKAPTTIHAIALSKNAAFRDKAVSENTIVADVGKAKIKPMKRLPGIISMKMEDPARPLSTCVTLELGVART